MLFLSVCFIVPSAQTSQHAFGGRLPARCLSGVPVTEPMQQSFRRKPKAECASLINCLHVFCFVLKYIYKLYTGFSDPSPAT